MNEYLKNLFNLPVVERQRSSERAIASLNINFDIEKHLAGMDQKTVRAILKALQEKKMFMLYADLNRFCLIVPETFQVGLFSKGIEEVVYNCSTADQFINRVKMSVVIYPKFFQPTDEELKLYDHFIQLIKNKSE